MTLNQKRNKIIRIFTEVFSPANILPSQVREPTAFNISVGQALLHYPIIRSALELLSVNTQQHMKVDKINQIFLSHYVNSNDDERALGALAVSTLAQNHDSTVNPSELQATLTTLNNSHYPNATLAQRWQTFAERTTSHKQQTFSKWVNFFQQQLKKIGWPGQLPLSSAEFQVMNCWQQTLKTLTQLDRLFPPVTKYRALQILKESITQTIFQPQSEDKPIQILGLLEAASCRFHALWVMGLDNETWPGIASPNPFLPIDLQRKLQMPHASAERELDFAKRTQHTLVRTSNHVIFSHSETEQDQTRRPSQLIHRYPIMHSTIKGETTTFKPNPYALEQFEDTKAPPVTQPENTKGGSWILKEQSTCPFRAFAMVRLKATKIESATLGLSAKKRGIITHDALDLLWKTLKTQQKLNSLKEHELESIVNEAIKTAIKAADLTQHPFITVETQRLKALITKWLDIEKSRPPFEVIARETKRHIKIAGLP